MPTLYVDGHGSSIRFSEGAIVVKRGAEVATTIPLHQIDRVVAVGTVQVTGHAMKEFFRNDIPVAFFGSHGSHQGSLRPATHKNVFLRLEQYRRYHDNDFRRGIARNIVWNKIHNELVFVRKHHRMHPETDLANEISFLNASLTDSWQSEDPAGMMGHEGAAAHAYFSALSKMIRVPGFDFAGRNRRPPKDPVNAMLSLGYTLLYNELLAATEGVGLDPYLGFLHEPHYGRASLAADLQEEFRHLVDEMVLAVINRRVLAPDQFETDAEKGCMLLEQGRKTFYGQYEKKLLTEVTYKGMSLSYRRILHHQARHMAAVIQGAEYVYTPYPAR